MRADSHRVHGFRPEASVRRSACDTWLFGRGTSRAAGQRWRGAFLFKYVDTDKLVDSADNCSLRRRGRRRGSGTGARRAVGPRRRGQMGTDVQSVHTTFSGSAASSSERSRYVVTEADFLATIHIDHHHPSTSANHNTPAPATIESPASHRFPPLIIHLTNVQTNRSSSHLCGGG